MKAIAVQSLARTFLLAAALVIVSAGMGLDLVHAAPKGHVVRVTTSIKHRTTSQVNACQDLGGTAEVTTVSRPGKGPFGPTIKSTTVTCSGGDLDGQKCVNVSKKMTCTTERVAEPTEEIDAGTVDVVVVQVDTVEPTPEAQVVDDGAVVDDSVVDGGGIDTELPAPSPTVEPTVIDIPTVLVDDAQVAPEATATVVVDDGSVDDGSVEQPIEVQIGS